MSTSVAHIIEHCGIEVERVKEIVTNASSLGTAGDGEIALECRSI